jgi:sugar transferase
MGSLVAVFLSVFARFFADEMKCWLPWCVKRVITYAVNMLPADQRERYGEEWRSDVNDIPGDWGKLIFALGLVRAARTVSSRDYAAQLIELGERVLAAFLVFAMAPVLLLIATIIKIYSKGPILQTDYYAIKGERRLRKIFRFSTFNEGLANLGPYATLHGFQRFTPITAGENEQLKPIYRNCTETGFGSFLRRTSLNKLPLFISVMRGDARLVGCPPFFKKVRE